MSEHAESSALDKWVQGIDSQGSVLSAAQYSLRSRLAAVQLYLPSAAISNKSNAGDVHQLRVATRRSLAALELYDSELPCKRAKAVHRSLKKIQRAAGDIRDLDVLIKRYRSDPPSHFKPIMKRLKKRRSDAQARLERLFEHMQSKDRFAKRVDSLLKKLKSTDSSEPLQAWVRQRWPQELDRFLNAAQAEMNDFDALHQFRIHSKALRYELELLAPVFAPEPLKGIYAWVEQLQERLGKIHDHVVARRMFHQWNTHGGRLSKSETLTSLCGKESTDLANQRKSFDSWWTPEMKSEMHKRLKQLLLLESSAVNSTH